MDKGKYKKRKVQQTPLQKKLISLILENVGKKGKKKSLEEMMIEAGYSKSTAKAQNGVRKNIVASKEFSNYIKRLEKHREKIIERMEKTIITAKYSDLSNALSRIENIILLGQGKSTENIKIINEEDKERLDEIIKENT